MGFWSRLFGRGGSVEKAASTKLVGSDGVMSYSGYLRSGERDPRLSGSRKWLEYANAVNAAIIATGIRYRDDLINGATWHAVENLAGGKDAARGVEIVEQGLLKARMPKPWSSVAAKSSMAKIYGFAMHEWSVRRRSDGMIVMAELAHRPQYTIDRWDKPDERQDWQGIWQRTRSGQTYYIPRNRLLYSVDDAITDSPDGTGLLRHIVELWRRLTVYERLEGVAYQSDLGGQPIARAPLGELSALGDQTYVDAATASIESFVKNRILTPEKLMWLLLDSDTFRGADANTITQIQKWAVEIIKSETPNLPSIDKVINRLQLEMARVLNIEFAMMGTGEGSRAVHEDKTSMLSASLQATLTKTGDAATRDLAAVLVALNGLDPETACPTIVADPISTESLLTITQSLVNMQLAALRPDDPAINVLRSWAKLPPAPEVTAMDMGLMPRATPPDPGKGEVDVQVNDLGDTSTDAPTNRSAA